MNRIIIEVYNEEELQDAFDVIKAHNVMALFDREGEYTFSPITTVTVLGREDGVVDEAFELIKAYFFNNYEPTINHPIPIFKGRRTGGGDER